MELEKSAQALVAPAKGLVAIDESFPSINTQFAYTGDALCHSKETASCRVRTNGFKNHIGAYVLSSR